MPSFVTTSMYTKPLDVSLVKNMYEKEDNEKIIRITKIKTGLDNSFIFLLLREKLLITVVQTSQKATKTLPKIVCAHHACNRNLSLFENQNIELRFSNPNCRTF
ncbi:MAG: hypothetical protein CW716_10360 [Candidatus Bathyarchaeum sp.]|nr:MAG: hypothetical protein CW716_10360 [Candidatus Bathyarchaeum sp.]